MKTLGLDHLLERLAALPWLIALGWIGLTIFTVGVGVVLYTRWGQYRPLRKCMVLSLLAHLVLATYATTIRIVARAPSPVAPIIQVSLIDPSDRTVRRAAGQAAPRPAAGPRAPDLLAVADRSVRPEAAAAPRPIPRASLEPPVPLPEPVRNAGASAAAAAPREVKPAYAVPSTYRLRVAADRAGVVRRHGGTPETEAAVRAALRWLADNQAADGRWDPRSHGGGNETSVEGQDRGGAGAHADAAMTGLALLSFLGSGHTHLEGPYRETVRRGLAYLMENQAADGNLAGEATGYEVMYCHGMAACALAEAFGMTHDAHLRETVERAAGYTVAAQDAAGGGWRYRPGEAGDTSQLGWQVMSLRSADLAGIAMPAETRQGIFRYLQSVASGASGGLASYQPGQPPSRSMTAEALVCWQLLGLPQDHPAGREAAAYLLGQLPGDECNLYYWYYATLALDQLQGPSWQTWNEALQRALLSRQVKQGPLAGSWETNDLWAGCGGRLYTTTLATLTLEVYYRFLPLYAAAGRRDLSR